MGGHNVRIWRVRRVRKFKREEREQEERAGNTEGKKGGERESGHSFSPLETDAG